VARIDRDDLDVTADDVLVLKHIGPKGAPGMPEAGYIPIPRKLARAGVKDMVRISDGRMSGTAFGTIVLHVTPERRSAARSRMCATATASASASAGARSRCSSATPNWRSGARDNPVVEPVAARGYRTAVPAIGAAGR
jgi:dihydroxy-acid dehydratase